MTSSLSDSARHLAWAFFVCNFKYWQSHQKSDNKKCILARRWAGKSFVYSSKRWKSADSVVPAFQINWQINYLVFASLPIKRQRLKKTQFLI